MAKPSPQTRKAIQRSRHLIEDIHKTDANEAETRRRVERIFEHVMGYDPFRHLSREHAVHGVGDTEHMDFAVKLSGDQVAMVVELKRVGVDLSPKHLRQALRYAIDTGCEWLLLTNGRQWELYHVEFGQPPQSRSIRRWDLLHDDMAVLAANFDLISYRSLRKGVLTRLWEKQSVLTPECLLRHLLSEELIRRLKNSIRKGEGVSVRPEEIVAAIRKILNEHAASLMDEMKISLPERTTRRRVKKIKDGQSRKREAEKSLNVGDASGQSNLGARE